MDTFDNLSETLAGFGLTLSERTRLTFGAPVLAALKEVQQGKGKVFVACAQGANIIALESKLSDDARKVARFIDATDYGYAQVRPHVANFAKSRKVPVTISPLKRDIDGESTAVGFTVSRKGK